MVERPIEANVPVDDPAPVEPKAELTKDEQEQAEKDAAQRAQRMRDGVS